MMPSPSDQDLLLEAEAHYTEERLLQAARLLRQVRDPSCLTNLHQKMLKNAKIVEHSVGEMFSTPNGGDWKKQGESHGHYDTSIYYKVQSGARLTCRIETPIPSSLLVPLLSVLNESSLYHTWIPSWTKPKLGVRQSKQLLNDTRGHQVIQIQCDVPWPMDSREVLMDVAAVDDIDENGFIIAKMRTLEEKDDLPTGFTLPALEKNMERAEFDGAFLFRACPPDHPNYASTKTKFGSEDLILLQFTMFFDAHMAMVPQSLINFVTRTVLGHIWQMLLHVAEQVREGTRQEHRELISKKATFYKWVEDRCKVMLQEMQAKRSCDQEESNGWTLTEVLKLSM